MLETLTAWHHGWVFEGAAESTRQHSQANLDIKKASTREPWPRCMLPASKIISILEVLDHQVRAVLYSTNVIVAREWLG